MLYSDLYLRPKFMPSKLLVLIAIGAVVASTFVYFSSGYKNTQAANTTLAMHKIVNVTSAQVGIYWKTTQKDRGWILYGTDENKLDMMGIDEYMGSKAAEKNNTHYVVLKNLAPGTRYYYQIISDGGHIASSGKNFSVVTAENSASRNDISPAYGKIISSTGKDSAEVDVFLDIQGAQTLYSKTGQSGEWLVPLQYIISSKDAKALLIKDDAPVTITAIRGESISRIRTTIAKTHPVKQAVVLGQNYMFMDNPKVLSAFTSKRSPAGAAEPHTTFSIRFPRDGAVIPGTAPLIKGYGIADKDVVVSINTVPPYLKKSRIDKTGEWNISFQQIIAPGAYTLTAQSVDQSGRVVVDKRSFTIIKSGEMVLGESIATPSATLEPTLSLTPSLTGSLSPTPSPAIYTGQPSVPEPPVSGINEVWPYAVTGAGLLFVGAGMVLVL